jgi:hypothetical protein
MTRSGRKIPKVLTWTKRSKAFARDAEVHAKKVAALAPLMKGRKTKKQGEAQ